MEKWEYTKCENMNNHGNLGKCGIIIWTTITAGWKAFAEGSHETNKNRTFFMAYHFIHKDICDVIKQNQSEVGHIQFSDYYWTVTSICKATFCRKPHRN